MEDKIVVNENSLPVKENESFSNIIKSMTPIIKDFLEIQSKTSNFQDQESQRNFELGKINLEIENRRINKNFIILLILMLFCFGLPIFMIFFLNETTKGLLVLSYIGTSVLAFIAGYGFAFRNNRK